MSWLDGRSIHQVVVTAAPGDAVTNSVLEIRALLRRYGESEIFACNVHEELRGEVLSTSDYDRHRPNEKEPLTLVHLSMGDDQFLPFVARIAGKLIVSYHNITPSEYFAPWDPSTAHLLDLGRETVGQLRDRTVLALADSSFNASDLHAAGYSDVRVGGLILGVERLLELEPTDLTVAAGGPVILSVGQLYPHKRADLIVAAFHEFVGDHPDAHLVLAGSSRLPAYARALARYVTRLGLTSRVTVTGHLSDVDLAAWYRRADLFVVASAHEGFCVPLAEAMQFDIPIVARANGAIPETLGDAGVLVPGHAGPRTLAAVMGAVLDDEPASDALRARGRARRSAFSAAACRRQFLDALEELAPK